MTDPQRERVSIQDAAKLAGVSRRTIYNWLRSGKIEACRVASGKLRIFTDSLWRQYDVSPVNKEEK
jgi:excisionase family DNA binding protein